MDRAPIADGIARIRESLALSPEEDKRTMICQYQELSRLQKPFFVPQLSPFTLQPTGPIGPPVTFSRQTKQKNIEFRKESRWIRDQRCAFAFMAGGSARMRPFNTRVDLASGRRGLHFA
jgi:hypothetical protein